MSEPRLLGPAEVRELAAAHGVVPTKRRGQNFVIDPNTVRRIVATADLAADDVVLEVGPGLGSLTLALLEQVARVIAVEVDQTLAAALPQTLARFAPDQAAQVSVVCADAASVTDLPAAPTALVSNLPYNLAVPVVLHLLATQPTIGRGLVMVQAEVAERLAAAPGSKAYGVPSVKGAWYGNLARAGSIGRHVFWPAPNVDSGLVSFVRTNPPATTATREEVFAVIDAAFAQRRKMLRAALRSLRDDAEDRLVSAGVDPTARAENLTVHDFSRIAEAFGGAS